MRRLTLLVPFASALLAFSCGNPNPGDKCDKTGFLCVDGSSAMECRGGVWSILPCRGATGCTRTNDLIRCDMSGNIAGDACASTAEGKGLCSSDGKSTLECREGKLVQTNTCSSCAVSGDQIVCQP